MDAKRVFLIIFTTAIVGVVFVSIFEVFKEQASSIKDIAEMQEDANEEQSKIYKEQNKKFKLLEFIGIT